MEQSNILISGTMRIGIDDREALVVEYGRKVTTDEALRDAPLGMVCAGEDELRAFDEKVGAFMEDDRPLVALDDLACKKGGAVYVKNHDGNAVFGQAYGYPYWAADCRFLFFAPVAANDRAISVD